MKRKKEKRKTFVYFLISMYCRTEAEGIFGCTVNHHHGVYLYSCLLNLRTLVLASGSQPERGKMLLSSVI